MPDDSEIQRRLEKLLARRSSQRTDAKIISLGRDLFDEERYELLDHAASRVAGRGTGAEEALAELNLRALWKQERFDAMVEYYDRLSPAVRDRPALAQRGLRALWKRERFDALVERFDRLSAPVQEQPALADLNLRALWKQERFDALVERFDRFSAPVQEQPALAELNLRALWKLERLEKLVERYELLSPTLQDEPALAELDLRALSTLGRLHALVDHFERLSPTVQEGRGLAELVLRALWKHEGLDELVACFDRLSPALQELPALAELSLRALRKQERLDELVACFDRLSPALQELPALAAFKLRALWTQQRLDELVACFDRLSPTLLEIPALAELNLGALWKQERLDELVACFDRLSPALQELPALAELNLGALWKLERYEELLDHIERANPTVQWQPEHVRLKAQALYRLERLQAVIDHLHDFKDIMDADPGLARAFERSLFKQASAGPRRVYFRELAEHLERCEERLANDAEAARMYAHAVSATSNDVEGNLSAWQHALALDPSNEATADSVRSLGLAAERMRAERARQAQWDAGAVQHVAILGMSYCGSTILGAVLGSLDGVENIGESFWLTHRKMSGNPPITDFRDLQRQHGIQYCATCGPDCQVFTATFRQELAEDPTLWYLKIARRVRSRIIVSSDKNYSKLLETDPLLRLDGIVLFKSPEQHWWSNLRKVGRTDASFTPIETLEKFMRRWCDDYGQLLHELEPRGKKLFLYFDEFCRNPEAHLQRLAKHLELPFEGSALPQLARDQHFTGGNAYVGQSYRSSTSPLAIKTLPIAPIPEEDVELLRRNEELQEAWRLCMQRYREAFPE